MQKREVELTLHSGKTLPAYISRPDDVDAPGVVVIHEVWGLDEHIRSVADRFAAAGFAAIAPDFIGIQVTIPPHVFLQTFMAIRQLTPEERAVPGKIDAVLAKLPDDQREQAQHLMAVAMRGPNEESMEGMDAAIRYLKLHGAHKVGMVGFCMGGAYTWFHAYSGGDADAYAPFYGRLPADPNPWKVKAPIEGHFGGADEGIPAEPIQRAVDSLNEQNKKATLHVYPGAPHAFFNDTRDTYRKDAAELAWGRVLAFFRKQLV